MPKDSLFSLSSNKWLPPSKGKGDVPTNKEALFVTPPSRRLEGFEIIGGVVILKGICFGKVENTIAIGNPFQIVGNIPFGYSLFSA
jgi:hypothetical protein